MFDDPIMAIPVPSISLNYESDIVMEVLAQLTPDISIVIAYSPPQT